MTLSISCLLDDREGYPTASPASVSVIPVLEKERQAAHWNTLAGRPSQSSEIQAQKQTASNGDHSNKDQAEKN